MALDEQHFDQDLSNGGGGWRALASKPGCELVAADILRDYRAAHHSDAGILFWHEGQLRAIAGKYNDAIPLLEKSRKPLNDDRFGWNAYVDATVAFLHRDKSAMADARATLAAVQPSTDEGLSPVENGRVNITMVDGTKRSFSWPPNLDVIDGLARCFDKSYQAAYGGDCREPAQ